MEEKGGGAEGPDPDAMNSSAEMGNGRGLPHGPEWLGAAGMLAGILATAPDAGVLSTREEESALGARKGAALGSIRGIQERKNTITSSKVQNRRCTCTSEFPEATHTVGDWGQGRPRLRRVP